VIHDHCAASVLRAARHPAPTVVTAHGPVDGEMLDYYRHVGPGVALVAVAEFQRQLAPSLPWVGTVHNATPADAYPFESTKSLPGLSEPPRDVWIVVMVSFPTASAGPRAC
jgi:hypothetical protein